MDAFFTSIEQGDNPQLAFKPVVVGGNKNRGVVYAASYEARKHVISSRTAYKLCNELIFINTHLT